MRKYRISLVATILAVLITSLFIYIRISFKASTGPYPMDWVIDLPEEDTAFGGLFYNPYINDSLPHSVFRRIEDSIKSVKDEVRLTNRGVGDGITYGPIGFENFPKKTLIGRIPAQLNDSLLKLMDDTLNNLYTIFPGNSNEDSIKRMKYLGDVMWRYNVRYNQLMQEEIKKAPQMYCLTLNGYTTDHDNKFFIQNDKFYLAIVKWDRVKKRTFDSTKVGHYIRKEILFRYSAEDEKIKIPISREKYNFLTILFTILYYAFLFGMAFIFFGLPVQILIDISRGKAFTKSNIRRFKIMAWVLLSYAFLKTFTPYIVNLFYQRLIPDELRLESVEYRVINNLYLFLIAIALFIISKAFEKGYNLQQEQDLTI